MFANDTPTIQQVVQALKSGKKNRARQMLQVILAADPKNDEAWVLNAFAANSRPQALHSLQKALQINPDNQKAQKGLEKLQKNNPTNLKPKSKVRTGIPVWAWMLFGITCLGVLIAGGSLFFIFPNSTAPSFISEPDPTRTPNPTSSPVPTRDTCDCLLSYQFLDRTLARFGELEEDITEMENEYNSGLLSSQFFSMYNGRAQTRYQAQFDEKPPECMQSFQTKVVSLFWNWQQTMEYSSSGNYDAATVFIDEFIKESYALEEEGLKIQESLQDCPQLEPDVQET